MEPVSRDSVSKVLTLHKALGSLFILLADIFNDRREHNSPTSDGSFESLLSTKTTTENDTDSDFTHVIYDITQHSALIQVCLTWFQEEKTSKFENLFINNI